MELITLIMGPNVSISNTSDTAWISAFQNASTTSSDFNDLISAAEFANITRLATSGASSLSQVASFLSYYNSVGNDVCRGVGFCLGWLSLQYISFLLLAPIKFTFQC